MKPSCLCAVAGVLALAQALAVERRQDEPAQVVRLQTQRRHVTDPAARDRIRRRGAFSATLDNEGTLYFVNATLGTPPQPLRLHVDTGSSDLWANTPASQLCSQKGDQCSFAGTYAANSSSTYEYVGSWFNISYVDGSGAAGDYATDTFAIGGQTVENLQFGIGYSSTSPEGIMGIGYEINEVQVGRAQKPAYKNLPAQLAADGIIASNSFSIWLDDLAASTGNILFGGIDSDKFEGTLATLPVEPEAGQFREFLVTLTGIQLGGTSVVSGQAIPVLLDSGSSLTYLPDDIANDIYDRVGAQYSTQAAAAYVPCSLASQQQNLSFTFTAPTIAVPMSELVIGVVGTDGRPLTLQSGEAVCLFGISPAGSGPCVLGDTFLRSAYVVFDLDNNQISIAQTRFNATGSSVQAIPSGAVPDATAVANPVRATGLPGAATPEATGLGESKSSSMGDGPVTVSLITLAAFVTGVVLMMV